MVYKLWNINDINVNNCFMVHTEGKNDKLEVWKDIRDYEGLYQGSNWGRVKSLDRWVKDTNGSLRFYKGKILKPVTNSRGYFQVGLCKNGKVKFHLVHRLVAEAFLDNPDNLPCVNHKDENKQNNNVENLEFCDCKYNINYGTARQRMVEKQSKKVLQYDLEGNFIREWKSTRECERNGFIQQAVAACCQGKRKTHKDSIWRYK